MKHLLCKAYTNSEWDFVDFALIELTKGHIDFVKQYAGECNRYKQDSFSSLCFYGDNADFFSDIEELPQRYQTINDDNHLIVSLKENLIQKLSTPEQTLKYGQIKFRENGVQYVSYGKHTDEEFWTPVIPYSLFQ